MGYYPPYVSYREDVRELSSMAPRYVEKVRPVQRSQLNRLASSLNQNKIRLKQKSQRLKKDQSRPKMTEYSYPKGIWGDKRGKLQGRHIDRLI